ncbi:MAG: hypothetical protein CVU34_08460 [Betaproteobacteria bacterium HGW-Betaproteobacteria-7]|jgi:hypothetical protein|nr:MAG: hypothetical protein CVU34_08460 [Betaproteobacteria bacterium HGW-Betaproteobacteria-7]
MPLVWLTALATAALAGGIAWYLAPLSPGVLVLQFAFTPRAFGEVIHLWSPEQLPRFRAHLPADYLLLLSYGLFGYLLARRTQVFQALGAAGRRWATWALPLAATFDATENACHWWLTAAPRFAITWPYLLATGSASAKWLLLLAFALTLVFALTRSEHRAH